MTFQWGCIALSADRTLSPGIRPGCDYWGGQDYSMIQGWGLRIRN